MLCCFRKKLPEPQMRTFICRFARQRDVSKASCLESPSRIAWFGGEMVHVCVDLAS
jgi:hypothetical protein